MIREVAAAWGVAADAAIDEVTGGLINRTWVADGPDGRLVLQRLHPVFGAEVNLDIDAVTRHAGARVPMPRVVPARTGALWIERDDHVFRALTYLPGTTIHRITDPQQATDAGRIVGAFHRAVADLDYHYRFTRAGVHDTSAHLARLASCEAGTDGPDDAFALAGEILDDADDLPEIPEAPRRHCHGDLKISNIRFAGSGGGLIDLDTVGLQTIAYELGDALRSWCNPAGEDTDGPELDLDILGRAMVGYAQGSAGLLTAAEIAGIAPGLATVTLELAARFCVDAFDDRYFGWDASRYSSRVDHNLVRAAGQLSLARSTLGHLDEVAQRIEDAFAS